MPSILFMRAPGIYLPEIDAYIDFLRLHYPNVTAFDSAMLGRFDTLDYDVVWRFMGTDFSSRDPYVIHEYNSLSAGHLPVLRNWIKAKFNRKPRRRIFLNDLVRRGFNFQDDVPNAIREMGIASGFFEVTPDPQYDFVYAGSIHRGNDVLKMLDQFTGPLRNATIYVIGAVRQDIRDSYKPYDNIIFAGRLPYEEVPSHMARGRYGLNLIPDRYPFNVQTATKVLEYCALGLPIVSMKYRWIESFVKRTKGSVFWLNKGFDNLSLQALEQHHFKTPNVARRDWHSVIMRSKIFEFLKEDF